MNLFLNFSNNFNTGWQKVSAAKGIQITLMGMFLCFLALAIIATIIALVPYLLKLLNRYVPEHDDSTSAVSDKKQLIAAGDDVVAAIGTALLYSMGSAEKE